MKQSVEEFLADQSNETCQIMAKGSDQPCAFMPFLGEYGVFILHYIRFVHFYKAKRKIVCCRKGDEIYFPSASGFFYDWEDPLPDYMKSGTMFGFNGLSQVHSIYNRLTNVFRNHHVVFSPKQLPPNVVGKLRFPIKVDKKRDLKVDVVFGARHRLYKTFRNWDHWNYLADGISDAGYKIGSIGKKNTSFQIEKSELDAWQHDDASANVELLNNCILYIGSDTGTTHLASFTSTPTIVFKYGDLRECCIREMRQTSNGYFNYVKSGWYKPKLVLETALQYLKEYRAKLGTNPIVEEDTKLIDTPIEISKIEMPHEISMPIRPVTEAPAVQNKPRLQAIKAKSGMAKPKLRGSKRRAL